MVEVITAEPLARLDYVSVADGHTLAEVEHIENGALVSMAVFIGKTRLIDNIVLGEEVGSGKRVSDRSEPFSLDSGRQEG
jgi:pantothenate synthetase